MLRFIRNWLIKRARSCTKCVAYASCPDADIAAFAFMYDNEVARCHRKTARKCLAYTPEVPEFNDTLGNGKKDYFVLTHHRKNKSGR